MIEVGSAAFFSPVCRRRTPDPHEEQDHGEHRDGDAEGDLDRPGPRQRRELLRPLDRECLHKYKLYFSHP